MIFLDGLELRHTMTCLPHLSFLTVLRLHSHTHPPTPFPLVGLMEQERTGESFIGSLCLNLLYAHTHPPSPSPPPPAGLMEQERTGESFVGSAFFTYAGINLAYVMVAYLMVVMEPIAAGSGIPEIKAFLNGVNLPRSVGKMGEWEGEVNGQQLKYAEGTEEEEQGDLGARVEQRPGSHTP